MATKKKTKTQPKRAESKNVGSQTDAPAVSLHDQELAVAKATVKKLKSTLSKLEKTVEKLEKAGNDLRAEAKARRKSAEKALATAAKKAKKAKKGKPSRPTSAAPPAQAVPAKKAPAARKSTAANAAATSAGPSMIQLRAAARAKGVAGYSRLRKDELIAALK